ncbi:hypothetical protein QBC34DRAFT_444252 [Podospora aff. communis PSN243]|uniref:F-box domain-containing protein n=1 Tax=Podospora aff. communis PSN243 TaxID=3040156 RepID=A0AAV9G288_9PEZI|nr:hypothetical protein QBC34DRAFT_444252 [Podospora aff. communis PSN243]
MASPFYEAPVEILILILGACDSTQDLLSLVTTCHHMHNIWRDNTVASILPVLMREVPLFEDALLAAHVTEIALEAEHHSTPAMRIYPSRSTRMPDLEQLRSALALHRLAQSLATSFANTGGSLTIDHIIFGEHCPPESAERMPAWKAQFHKLIYRNLIAGAALAGAYNAPISEARISTDPEIQRLTSMDNLEAKHFAFFRQFAVANTDASAMEDDHIFGRLESGSLTTSWPTSTDAITLLPSYLQSIPGLASVPNCARTIARLSSQKVFRTQMRTSSYLN